MDGQSMALLKADRDFQPMCDSLQPSYSSSGAPEDISDAQAMSVPKKSANRVLKQRHWCESGTCFLCQGAVFPMNASFFAAFLRPLGLRRHANHYSQTNNLRSTSREGGTASQKLSGRGGCTGASRIKHPTNRESNLSVHGGVITAKLDMCKARQIYGV